MNKIKEYKIVRGPKAILEADISKSIAEGWQPHGPLTVSDHKESSYPILFQAMVKYEKD